MARKIVRKDCTHRWKIRFYFRQIISVTTVIILFRNSDMSQIKISNLMNIFTMKLKNSMLAMPWSTITVEFTILKHRNFWVFRFIKYVSGIFLVLKPGYYHITSAAHGYSSHKNTWTGLRVHHNGRIATYWWEIWIMDT